MQTPNVENLTRPLRLRFNLAQWLATTVRLTGAWLAVWATGFILIKLFWPDRVGFWPSLLALTPVLLLVAHAWCLRRGRYYSTAEIVEHLDHLYRRDGSVSTWHENPELLHDPNLPGRIRAVAMRHWPRLRVGFYLKRIAPAMLYAIAAAGLPARTPAYAEAAGHALETVTRPLEEELAGLAQWMPEPEIKQLREQLEQIATQDVGLTREGWEAIEALDERIKQAEAVAAEQAAELAHSMNEMAGLARESMGQPGLSAEQQARMSDLLEEMKSGLNASDLKLNRKMSQEMLDQLKQLKPGKPCTGGQCKSLAQMAEKLGQCSGTKLGAQPGRGGINRGRGDAAMAYGDPDRLADAAYEQKLVENPFLAAEDLVDLGITPIEPEPDPGRFSPGTIRVRESDGPREAISRTHISPSQVDVVSRYFSEQE